MLRAVNHKTKSIICCPFMCGTTFLHGFILQNNDWEHYRGNWDTQEYTKYRVVRDPIQRFYSWYNKFIVNNKDWFDSNRNRFVKQKIEKKNVSLWFDDFAQWMHYDGHTGLQQYIHLHDERFLGGEILYIESQHLQKFLEKSQDNYKEKEYTIPFQNKSDKRLIELYASDIEWKNNLRIIK